MPHLCESRLDCEESTVRMMEGRTYLQDCHLAIFSH